MKNLLFIPCYRCAPQIVRVLEDIKCEAHFFSEILIIDNISPDGTASAALNFINDHHIGNARVVTNPANIGLGGSHKLAFLYAQENNFDHVVILHGDDQGKLSDLSPLLDCMNREQLESFWMGARFHPKSSLESYSVIRIIGNVVYNCLASLLTTRTIYDLGGSGANIFPVKLLKKHPFLDYANDLTFHVYLLLNALRLGQPLAFTPVSWREDDQISNVKLVQQSVKLLKILKSYFFSKNILREVGLNFNFTPDDWK